jgi:hypothetical protein
MNWRYLLEGHPELGLLQQIVMEAVRAPDWRLRGRWADEEWFYLATNWPSRWLKVVVRYEAGKGRIVTAFPRRSLP